MTRSREEAVQPEETKTQFGQETQKAKVADSEIITISSYPPRSPVKIRDIYASAYVTEANDMMDKVIEGIDRTELSVVITDVEDGQGRITYAMDSSTVNEIGTYQVFIRDMPALMARPEEHGIYTITRVVVFRDPYLAEQEPEWSLHVTDDKIYRDNRGLAWVNPYKKEVWDYLVEVGKKAGEVGFDEIQFDYIQFAVGRTMNDVVFDDGDTQGRNKTQAITEFVSYAYGELAKEGLFVSTDVFDAIMRSEEDVAAMGQEYEDMAEYLDCICPTIYPSRCEPGNLGIKHPDTQPYDTVLGALNGSRELLTTFTRDDTLQAVVRPWLQDLTASYLEHYIRYGDEQMRQQIQTIYDAGYDQWIFWGAGVSYHYGGLLTPEEAVKEDGRIARSRAATETGEGPTNNTPVENTPAEDAPAGHTSADDIPPTSTAR